MSIKKRMHRFHKMVSRKIGRLAVFVTTLLYTAVIFGTQASADVSVTSGVDAAKTTAKNTIKPVVTNDVVPVLAGVGVVIILFNLVKFFQHKRGGEEFGDNLRAIGIGVVCLALILAFNTWGWKMIGW